jgi:flavin-dependent dehydrogenase
MERIRHIVIVGGGTAGWITAGALAARFSREDPEGLRVTLIESPGIAAIGVGEGTWPSIRDTLQAMRIGERDFLAACDATFKQASHFRDWLRPGHAYYHPFTAPRRFEEVSLADLWLDSERPGDFADFVSFQPALCDQDRAPKTLSAPDYQSVANYAYHLDAVKFAGFLKAHCLERLGVTYISAEVRGVENDADGYITALRLEGQADVSGDLFIDCTGFKALLAGGHYGSPLSDVRDELFVDTALAIQVPYATPAAAIRSSTLSTAQAAGWIWDIGLQTRRGIGYVYSSAFSDEAEARATLSRYVGAPALGEQARRIPINAGYRTRPWVRNCVAVGLASGFVEPLEASSIVMIELAVKELTEQMPATRADMAALETRFNERSTARWRAIVDFLKLHYALSARDEPFWRANREPSSLSGWLTEQLQLWKTRVPAVADFPRRGEIFPAASYQYVLYGMGYETQRPAWRGFGFDRRRAELALNEVERAKLSAAQLPANRACFAAPGHNKG